MIRHANRSLRHFNSAAMRKFGAPAPFRGFQSHANDVKEHMIKGMEHTTKAKECAKKAKNDMHEAQEHTSKATSNATRIPRDANLTMKTNDLSDNLKMKVNKLCKEVDWFTRTREGRITVAAFLPIAFYRTWGAFLIWAGFALGCFYSIVKAALAIYRAAAGVPEPLQTPNSQL